MPDPISIENFLPKMKIEIRRILIITSAFAFLFIGEMETCNCIIKIINIVYNIIYS